MKIENEIYILLPIRNFTPQQYKMIKKKKLNDTSY